VLGISVSSATLSKALQQALRAAARPTGLAVVIGGAGATPKLAKSLEASLAPRELPAAVGALRRFAA
jgi:hypothetical protein